MARSENIRTLAVRTALELGYPEDKYAVSNTLRKLEGYNISEASLRRWLRRGYGTPDIIALEESISERLEELQDLKELTYYRIREKLENNEYNAFELNGLYKILVEGEQNLTTHLSPKDDSQNIAIVLIDKLAVILGNNSNEPI